MILGPGDPRAITGKDRKEAEALTEEWNEFLGIKPLTKAQKVAKQKRERELFEFLGLDVEDPS